MTDDSTQSTADDSSTTDAAWTDSDRDADRGSDRGSHRDADRGSHRDDDTDRGGEWPGRSGRRGRRSGSWANADLYERLQWVALVVLVLVAVATLFQFYTNVSRFIAIWASRKYEPAIQAAFALAVLASSLAGIAALSRNLR